VAENRFKYSIYLGEWRVSGAFHAKDRDKILKYFKRILPNCRFTKSPRKGGKTNG